VRVAVGQLASVPDKGSNLRRALSLVGEAADGGAQLVVLPEATMYPFGVAPDELAAAAEPLEGPFASELADAATRLSITVVVGLFEVVPGRARVYNTVAALGADGSRGRYRKLHLFDALGWRESDLLEAGPIDGDELLVVKAGRISFGVVTCYDLRFPELFRALVDRGATAFAVPSAWVAGPLKESHWEILTRARAVENTCYLLGAAQPPPQYCGRSVVVDPMGVVTAGVAAGEGLAFAEITAERVLEVREALPVLAHRRYRVLPA